jgi:ribonuclease HI
MGAQQLTARFSQVQISTIRRGGNGAAIGMVFRNRQGSPVRKVAYQVDTQSPDQAALEAVLYALEEAARWNVRSLTVYLDTPQTVDQLNRRAHVEPELMPLYAQVRCAANALGRVRFLPGGPENTFAARRLARSAMNHRETVNIEYDTPLLPLSFGEERLGGRVTP